MTFANQIALSLMRWTEAETAGKELDEVFRIVNEFTRATVENPVIRVLREGAIVGLANHTILIARDGSEVPIDDSAAPIRSGDGAVQGTVLVFRDITERRRAEAAGHLLSAIVESSEDAIISKDLGRLVTSWNQGAERMLGYSADEMIGHSISVLSPPDRPDEMPENLRRIRAGERVGEYQTVRRTKDGTLIHASVAVSPVHDASGRITGASKIIRDVTEHRHAEGRSHLAVEAAPNGMIVANERGEIVLVNSSTEKQFGYSRVELIGKPVELLVPLRFRDSHQRDREGFLAEPRARPMGAGRDLFGRRKDGSEFPVEIGLNPIQTDREVLILGSVVDISARTEVETTRRLLASVVESSADAIVTADLDGIVMSWNSGAEGIFGYSAKEVIGHPISIIVPPEHVGEWRSVLARVRKGERAEQHETVRRAKGGKLVDVAVSYSPMRDASGQIVGSSRIIRDITERKQGEQQRLELLAQERVLASERALRETEAELARVVRALSLGDWPLRLHMKSISRWLAW